MHSSAIAGRRSRESRLRLMEGRRERGKGQARKEAPQSTAMLSQTLTDFQLALSTLGLRLLCCSFSITIAQQTLVYRIASWCMNSGRTGYEQDKFLFAALLGKNHEEEHKHPERKITLSVRISSITQSHFGFLNTHKHLWEVTFSGILTHFYERYHCVVLASLELTDQVVLKLTETGYPLSAETKESPPTPGSACPYLWKRHVPTGLVQAPSRFSASVAKPNETIGPVSSSVSP